jgi:cell division protein FtsB
MGKVAEPANMRWLIVFLVLAVLAMQGQLWFADDGYRKTRDLRQAVAAQRRQNEDLETRNAALEAEVTNLKQGLDAAEERARTDLGMIGPAETFYQVVPPAAAAEAHRSGDT